MTAELDHRIKSYLGYTPLEPHDLNWIGATVALSMKVHGQDYTDAYDLDGVCELDGEALSSMVLGDAEDAEDADFRCAMDAFAAFNLYKVNLYLDDPKLAHKQLSEVDLQLVWLYISTYATLNMRDWLEDASDVATEVEEKLCKKAAAGDDEAEEHVEELEELAAYLLAVADEIETSGAYAKRAERIQWLLNLKPEVRNDEDKENFTEFLNVIDTGEVLLDIGKEIGELAGGVDFDADFGELMEEANSKKRSRDDDVDYDDDSDDDD